MRRFTLLLPFVATASLAAQVTTVRPIAPVEPFVTMAPMSVDVNMNMNMDYQYAEAFSTYKSDLLSYGYGPDSFGAFGKFGVGPFSWAPSDPADTLFRNARDLLNKGDYRKAADLFKALPQKYPSSAYVADAQYWQAYSLYRIGGTSDLQEALAVLEARKPTHQDSSRTGLLTHAGTGNGVSKGGGLGSNHSMVFTTAGDRYAYSGSYSGTSDGAALAARIANVLSSRGMGNDAAVKRALASSGNSCDQEEQAVRAEALSALMQNDPEGARQATSKILARRDECSVPLRRSAVQIVGNKKDDAAAATLIPVAKNDPSPAVRMEALNYLSRLPGDAAFNAISEIARTTDSTGIQRAAVSALSNSSNPRARSEVRSLIEKNDAPENLRMSALNGFDRDRVSADDATWLRSAYPRITSARVKARIAAIIGQVGGDANNQWLTALVKNEDEPLEVRSSALNQAGRTMDIATLGKIYDSATNRPIRSTVIDLLSSRKEPAAVDKLIDIAKNGTDPTMRREAISALSRSKDPRAAKLLLELIDK